MKKNLLGVISIIGILILITGCQSTKQTEDSLDDYEKVERTIEKKQSEPDEENDFIEDDEDVEDVLDANDNYEDETSKNEKNLNKKKKISWTDFFSSSFKYYPYDESSVFSTNLVGKLSQFAAEISYFPKKDCCGYGTVYLAAYYYLQFPDETRHRMMKAYENYLSDFENKRLNKKDKKSHKTYGKSEVFLNFGTIKASCINNSVTECYFGYTFKDKSPYFTITVMPGYNNRFTEDDTAPTENLFMTYYFTKAQMKYLLESLSDENVNEIRRQYFHEIQGGELQDSDQY